MQPVLTVNGHEVSEEEFRWFMEQERSGVFRHFKNKYGLEDGQGFWAHEMNGMTPRAMLRSNSVARITREKVEQMVFQEVGLVKDLRYAALLAQLEKLNGEREKAVRQGRVVYGPVRYTQLQFYRHWKATLRAQAEEKLAEKQWAPTAEELTKFYDENRALFRAPSSSSIEVVTVQTRNKAGPGEGGGTVRSAAGGVLARLKAGSALADVLKEHPPAAEVSISGRRFEEINADRLGEIFPDEQQLKAVLALGPGDATLLNDSNAQAKVVRCLGKTPETYRSYEAVQPQVRERWLAQQYDRHIERLASQAKVRVNQEAIDALFRPAR